ncbi:polysaccharide deacetylase family protein [Microbacterium sp. zg.B48]|uniref:polysaccharide deacetylase family protein n=1 Tax=Microbacterium sp. zg.B48 TaxID=2969408 RepID=UPI00214B9AD7|nr:polysaccharide deacetylase family protein [Microbacterium sp. zg.B48]MCR2764187.1 polysaccharide deacetylase family protein [Microbacterium sp. zg.B48]
MITNICFHGVGVCTREREEGEARYWVRETHFLRMLDEIATHPNVGISFDDGNISDAAVALPAMEDRGLTGTFFALAGRLEDPASLSPGDLRLLRTAGMQIGSHGWSHISWRRMSDQVAARELVDARAELADASRGPVDEAALPLGQYDRGVINRLQLSGYARVYSSDRFPARPNSWFQARYSVTAEDTRESMRELILRRPGLTAAGQLLKSAIKRVR